ncbi:hypothetical protein FKO01_25355 [Mesorhizobium sp. B2-3-3]|nr:hypothetical protein FKO01_25355 [Mesorhizobium sp. B2-3-3]
MMNGTWKLEALSSLLCVVTGIFLGLALAGATTGFGGWVFQWQTLVAGVLAVAAAAVTVTQMERTDIRQQKRHIELVRLGLRSDRLTMLRLRDVWLNKIVAEADILAPALATLKEARQTANHYSPIGLNNAMTVAWESYWRLKEILEDSLFEEARPFFDGTTTAAKRRIEESIAAIKELNASFSQLLDFGKGRSSWSSDPEHWVNMHWDLAQAAPTEIQRFAAEIRRTAALYE